MLFFTVGDCHQCFGDPKFSDLSQGVIVTYALLLIALDLSFLKEVIRTCFLDRRSFFDPKKLFWSITQKLYARSSYNFLRRCAISIKLLPFSNLDFSFGAVRELKFTIQFMAPRLPHK